MQPITPILIDSSFKGLVILLLATVVTAVMRKRSAAARHLVWAGAVVAILAMPALSHLLPGLGILPEVLPARAIGERTEPIAIARQKVEPAARSATTLRQPAPEPSARHADSRHPAPVTETALPPTPHRSGVQAGESVAVDQTAPPPAPAEARAVAPWWRTPLAWLPWVWLGGALFALIPLVLGWLSLRHLKRTSEPVTAGPWQSMLEQLSSEIGLNRSVVLVKSPCRTMPMTWGALPGAFPGALPGAQATVLIPEDADEWSADRRRAVLLHELAHIQRFDCTTQTLTQLACALYWFNPLVWFAARRMLIERERACDDLVLQHETKASDYAQHLLDIATGPQADIFAAYAGITMARRSKLDGRLVAILDPHRNRKAMTRLGVAVILMLVGAVAIAVAMLQADGADAAGGVVAQWEDDIKIELLGVGPHPLQPTHSLWSAEGRPIRAMDLEQFGVNAAMTDDEIGRDVVVAFSGLDQRDNSFITRVTAGRDRSHSSEFRRSGSPDDALTAVTFAVPKGTQTTNIIIGLSAGPWQTVGRHHFGDGAKEIRIGDQVHLIIDPPSTDQGRSVVGWRRKHIDEQAMWDIRIVTHVIDGPIRVSHSTSRGGYVMRHRSVLPFAPDDVDYFEIQVRPYRYVRFRNVSLQPGHETQVEVEHLGIGAKEAHLVPVSLSELASQWVKAEVTYGGAPAITLTDAEAVSALSRFFPKLGEAKQALDSAGWDATLTVTFHAADGETIKVIADAKPDEPHHSFWRENGRGDYRIRDPAGLVAFLQAMVDAPVQEQTIFDLDESKQHQWLDLDTGRRISLTERPRDPAAWLAERGADLGVEFAGNGMALVSVGLVLNNVSEKQWDALTPDDFPLRGDKLKGDDPGDEVIERDGLRFHRYAGRPKLPLTFGFQTREGAQGLLQVVDYTDGNKGIRVRYKLVQEARGGDLAQWLEGKEIVEVTFAGAHMDPLKLRDSLKLKVDENDWDFRLTPGEGGGADRAFVTVCMRVTPENRDRLLALQAELDPRGYRLEAESMKVWSYPGEPAAREQAQKLAPQVMEAMRRLIETAVPEVVCDLSSRDARWAARLHYHVPDGDVSGTVCIDRVDAMKRWYLPMATDQHFHLPHLGLMVSAYYRPAARLAEADAESPEHEALREAVRRAVAPLLALEAEQEKAAAPDIQPDVMLPQRPARSEPVDAAPGATAEAETQ